jgi:hypothetical protein
MGVKAAKRDDPRAFTAAGGIRAEIAEPKAGAKKLGSFSGNAYTGVPMKPEGWWQSIVVDFAGVRVANQHRPVLRQHDHNQIVGHTTSVSVDPAQGILIEGVFSGERQHTDKVTVPARNGFQWQLSIGANPVRTEFLEAGESAEVNGRQVAGPLTISRETELGEISFVPLGADGDTSATVSASTRKGNSPMFRASLAALKKAGNVHASKFSDDDIAKMTEDEAKAALKKCMKADADPDKKVDAEEDEDEDEPEEGSDLDAEEDEDDPPPAKAKAAKGKKGIASAAKNAVQAARAATAKELERQDKIRSAVVKHGVTHIELDGKRVSLEAHAIKAGWSAQKTELAALRAARPAAGVGTGPLVYSTSSAELNEAVLECAVFQATRCPLFDDDFFDRGTKDREPINRRDAQQIKAELKRRYPEKVQDSAHALFHGRIGLHQLLTTIAREGGYRGRETISADNLGEVAGACSQTIRADGGSTISVANVTANVLNKFLLAGYLFTEQTWKEICAIRSTKDFKPTKSVNLFGDFEFKDVGTSGELDNATLQDQAFANKVTTRGRILTIPRTTIINDDLGAFGQVPMLMGRGAGLRLNKVFWMKFMSPGYDDGGSTNFFAATHTLTGGQVGNSNLSSGRRLGAVERGAHRGDAALRQPGRPDGLPARARRRDAALPVGPPDDGARS